MEESNPSRASESPSTHELIMNAASTAAALLSGFLASATFAGEPDLSQSIAPPVAPRDWEFEFGIYGFIAGLDASMSVGGLTVEKEFEFGDILDHLDATFMASASATKGRFRLSADILYIGISGSALPSGPAFDLADLELDSVVSTFSGTWRVWEMEEDFLEIGAGARYLGMDVTADLVSSSGATPSQRIKIDEGFWDMLFVVRYQHVFSPRWFVRCYGDVGAGDSDLTWQAFVNVGYMVNDCFALMLGWRHIDYRQSSSAARLNLFFSGPQLSAGFRF